MIYQAVARYVPQAVHEQAQHQFEHGVEPDEQCSYHGIDVVKVWFHEHVDGRTTLWYTRVETWGDEQTVPFDRYWLHGQVTAASAHSWLIQNFGTL